MRMEQIWRRSNETQRGGKGTAPPRVIVIWTQARNTTCFIRPPIERAVVSEKKAVERERKHWIGKTRTYSNTGSPTVSISCMTHFKSKALARTILNIFCTLIDAEVEQKISEACMALANRFACEKKTKKKQQKKERRVSFRKVHIIPSEGPHLLRDLLLLIPRKRGKRIKLGPY